MPAGTGSRLRINFDLQIANYNLQIVVTCDLIIAFRSAQHFHSIT